MVRSGQSPRTEGRSANPTRASVGLTAFLAASVLIVITAVPIGGQPAPRLVSPGAALGVPTPTSNTSTLDLGMILNLSLNVSQITGGSNNTTALAFAWTGLPSGCASNDSANLSCVPTLTGTFHIRANVTDANASASGTSPPIAITVNSDPTVQTFNASAASLSVGGSLTFTTTATGGSSPLTYVYGGLPSGCDGSAATITCNPSSPQAYNCSVYVVDSLGVASDALNVSVRVVPPATSSSSSGPTGLQWGEIGAILVIGFVVVAALFVQARRVERQAFQGPASGAAPPSSPDQGRPPGASGGS